MFIAHGVKVMKMINSRDLKDLHPKVAAMCSAFVNTCKSQGIDVLITSTLRDNESQNALYAQGRTTKGSIVTNAKAGQSFHNYGVAFDFCPIVNGKCQWNDAELFKRCGVIAESVGLEWSGRWSGKMKETAHCQYTGGLTIQDLQSGKKVT